MVFRLQCPDAHPHGMLWGPLPPECQQVGVETGWEMRVPCRGEGEVGKYPRQMWDILRDRETQLKVALTKLGGGQGSAASRSLLFSSISTEQKVEGKV